MMESFSKTLKHEEVNQCQYESYQELVTRPPHLLEDVHNNKSLHSASGTAASAPALSAA